MHREFTSCIEACDACARACDDCASQCLRDGEVAAMVRCIALDMDCADLCRLASAYLARGSEQAAAVCRFCADVCEACARECAKHGHAHCQACAQACTQCAEACRSMAQSGVAIA